MRAYTTPMVPLRHLLLLAALAIAGCSRASTDEKRLSFFVAASTREACEQIAADFQKQRGIHVEVVPGPSSGLVKQISLGADADLFLSADQASADYLATQGLVAERRNLLTNRLVVIVPVSSKLKLTTLKDLQDPQVRRLALAEPKVPAGEYARDALAKAGVLKAVQDRIVGGVDVRATLQFVARDEADAGIVYFTDALGNSKVRVALEIDPSLHQPIVYPLVLLNRPTIKSSARDFYDCFGSEAALAVFRRAQFGVLP
jgi:molybdate transport system substrate-binding protein